MRKGFFRQLLLCICLLTGARLCAASNTLPDPAFHLSGRDFSRAEALLLTGGEKDPARARILIVNNLPAAASIVVCSRSGIELSQESTLQSLRSTLMLMAPAAREKFLRELADNQITLESWLQQQAGKLENQLNDAVRRWYIKNYADRSEITPEQINSWYYHHMDLFRRTEVKPELIWVFAADDEARMRQALAALQQGVPPEKVRKQHSQYVSDAELLNDLQKNFRQRTAVAPGFEMIKSPQHIYLLKPEALRQFYLPLDAALQQAIGNALYDAQAKAILSEILKKEFSGEKIKFY